MNQISPKTYTQSLAEFAAGTTYDHLPEATVKAAKRIIMDTLACNVGGIHMDSSKVLHKVIAAQGGTPEATCLGTGEKLPVSRAAYINAHNSNALDADDSLHYKAHLAAVSIPSALAMAERQKASGSDLIASTVIGYDVAARIGMSLKGLMISPEGELKFAPVSGYSWCGFSAAVSAGWLMGMDAEAIRHVMGITAASIPLPSSTQFGTQANRPMTKYGMYGVMAEAGVQSALLAEAGFTGLPAVLDGEKGLWRALGSLECNYDAMTDRLGERWFVEEASYKVYPACRFTSAATDMFYDLTKKHNIRTDEISHIDVELIAPALAKGLHDPTVITLIDGQFNMAYALAVAAMGITPGPQWHSLETRNREDVRAFLSKVTTTLEPTSSAITSEDIRTYGHARRMPAAIRIHARGEVFADRAVWAKGDVYDPATVLTDAEMETKFRDFCDGTLSADQIDDAIGAIWSLDEQKGLDGLIASLVR